LGCQIKKLSRSEALSELNQDTARSPQCKQRPQAE
jgi:hypothetical protein